MSTPKNNKIILILVTALILVGIAAFFGLINNQPSGNENNSVLGTSQKQSEVAIKVLSTDQLEVESGYGKKVIRLGVEVQNDSNADLLLSPGLQTFLSGNNGTLYNYTAVYNNSQPVGGVIESGSKIKLDLDYEIPNSVYPKSFIFQKDATSAQIETSLN